MTETTDRVPHGVNVPLLRKVLEHVTAHPEEWDQGTWATRTPCGTSFCIAGHTVLAEGHDFNWSIGYEDEEEDAVELYDGRSIPEVAAAALGITYSGYVQYDEGHLFYLRNTLQDVWRISSELTHGEIEIPADLRSDVL